MTRNYPWIPLLKRGKETADKKIFEDWARGYSSTAMTIKRFKDNNDIHTYVDEEYFREWLELLGYERSERYMY